MDRLLVIVIFPFCSQTQFIDGVVSAVIDAGLDLMTRRIKSKSDQVG